MGVCFSSPGHARAEQQSSVQQACEIQRLPPQLLAHIFSLLPQQDLLCIAPRVCSTWQQIAHNSTQCLALNLSSHQRQLQLPYLTSWIASNGQQLQQLKLSTSKPLGPLSRWALLQSLSNAQPNILASLALQLDLEVPDLEFLTQQICSQAPMLRKLKLQPVNPSVADLQLLVLACIWANLVGADTPGPVLRHLANCSTAVQQLAATVTQLQSLSLSRYQIANTDCVSSATQLTGLCLQHCGLADASLEGLTNLTRLQRLELSDNSLTTAALQQIAVLSQLTYLDLSVMPTIGRMRGSVTADLGPLAQLQALQELNIIGLGVTDASALSSLTNLSRLEIGLNPLSARSLRTIGQLPSLKHLELGGISQAWVLSSGLPPSETLRAHDVCWYGLNGLQQVTCLDLGGSNFNHAVWVCHMCTMLCAMPNLKRLQLPHCHIPPGKLLQLLVGLKSSSSDGQTPQIQDLSLDRCIMSGIELEALLQLTSLTKLSLVSMAPKLSDKHASVLAQLSSLKSLSVRNNLLGSKGVDRLGKGLVKLTCLDWSENSKVGKKVQKQYGHLLEIAEASIKAQLETGSW